MKREEFKQLRRTFPEATSLSEIRKAKNPANRQSHHAVLFRLNLRLSQTQAALLLGVSPNTVAGWESGRRTMPPLAARAYQMLSLLLKTPSQRQEN